MEEARQEKKEPDAAGGRLLACVCMEPKPQGRLEHSAKPDTHHHHNTGKITKTGL
jgi:hypothetical protein